MRYFYQISAFFLLLTGSLSAWAGGAHQTNIDGHPYVWDGAMSFNLDPGALKSGEYNEAVSRQMVLDAVQKWQAVLQNGALSIAEGAALPEGDVNGANYAKYLNSGEAVNPIVFDEDGEIIDAIFGECSKFSLLAFAGFERLGGGKIEKARAVFSGACIPDANGNTLTQGGCGSCVVRMDEPMVKQMILHEVGHLLGMDHAQVNPDSYQSCRATGSCTGDVAQDIPTMFPIAVPGAAMDDLHADDIAYFNRLYGDPGAGGCSVSGRVLADDGQSELRGVEVVARNVDPILESVDAMSFVSGAEAPRFDAKDKSAANCKSNCGDYLITGLQEGETYRLCVQNILSQFVGASGIEPVDPPLPQVEAECFDSIRVTCECGPSGCDAFSGEDLITKAGNIDAQGNLTQDDFGAAGGCSLVKPRTQAWRVIRTSFLDSVR